MISELYNRSEDWLKYAIQINLLHSPKEDQSELLKSALQDEKIQQALQDVAAYHKTLVTNHKNPILPIQRLLFLLDLGFGVDIPEIKIATDEILAHKDENGVYLSMTNIPKHFGGTGEDTFSWSLCDAPSLLLALFQAGVDYMKHIKPGVDYLVSLCRENGFPCAVSAELGKFRGPGRKDDCCPYATLIMADLLSYMPEYRDSSAARISVESLLDLWVNSLGRHPYLFYMGTDFRKLKAPSCWYDIVSVAGVLSKYSFIYTDPRFLEMIDLIKRKQDENGFFTPESIYIKLKDWDFSQKKATSPYLTYLCIRIFERLNADKI
ncbi:MAG: hypothetical protein LLF75_08905 [Eubacteriales bacterium]|nr:hypothetical protein [Eubacteriales bacterium]